MSLNAEVQEQVKRIIDDLNNDLITDEEATRQINLLAEELTAASMLNKELD